MAQRDYLHKAKPCPCGIDCCGCGSFGPRGQKRKSRRYTRRVAKQMVRRELREDV